MTLRDFLKSKVTTVLLVLVFIGIVTFSFQIFARKYKVNKEIQGLQDQASKLDGENQQLSELIKYLNTPEYAEKQAREKLNLKREGEQVVVLPDSVESDPRVADSRQAMSNPDKWFEYLFAKNND